MSQANVPNITPNISLTREESVNLILSSIALQELGLAHIINAEGEKIQYALGLLTQSLSPPPTFDQLIQLNKSVQSTLQGAVETEIFLKAKLEAVLQEPTLTGPTGPQGPTGSAGPQGVTGPTGVCTCPCPVIGAFRYTVPGITGPVIAPNEILPYAPLGSSNTPGAFTITTNGCVMVNECGVYKIDVRVQSTENSTFCLSLNGGSPGSLQGGAVCNCGTIYISAFYNLNAGDVVCVYNCGVTSTTLLGAANQGDPISAQSVINFTQICPC
ncbi:hypothetical protein CO726_30250 [Bacillus fungorum]|uniref:Collagen-like protein n=1 Tax=Bacillus fungorum TaxID=2039284 RepID=A0A2G6Q4R8_9BACI|nr:collagen-like protein [Bacillus fungorum]PIE91781.1 hypothetical protein CO726_30250 [Bacillus fungorum]